MGKLQFYSDKQQDGDPKSAEQQDSVRDAPFPLTDVDKWVLSQNDEDFHLHNWNELKEIIGEQKATFFLNSVLAFRV